jgi:hypothetical protein
MGAFLKALGEFSGGLVPGYVPALMQMQFLLILLCFAALSAAKNQNIVVRGGKLLSGGLYRLHLGALVAVSLCAMILSGWLESASPVIHDEFSYLLAADTYASGRLTNPSHPKWEFFETFHVLAQPSYQSKYLPSQGLILALGKKLFDQPIVGIWIFLCFGIAATHWMLRGWFNRKWSMLGAVLAAYIVAFNDISQTFFYNPCAFLGAALVMGSGKRIADPLVIRQGTSIAQGVAWGIGAGLLMLSRPFEGAFFCVAIIAWMLWKTPLKESVRRQALLVWGTAAAIVVGAFGAFLLYYNRAVTGDYFTFPYVVYDQRYFTFPAIVWQKFNPATHWTSPFLEEFYSKHFAKALAAEWQLESITNFLAANFSKLERFFVVYPNAALTPVFLLGIAALWRSKDRALLVTLLPASLFVMFSTSNWMSSYGMHLIGPVALCSVFGFRSLFIWHRTFQREGARIALSLVVSFLVTYPWIFSYRRAFSGAWFQTIDSHREVLKTLDQIPGKLVLFVSYEDASMAFTDWVYNPADIDSARVVWARDLGDRKDQELLDYYGDREKVTMKIGLGRNPANSLLVPTYTLKRWPKGGNFETATDSLSVHK